MKKLFYAALMVLSCVTAHAQKVIYIPDEWKSFNSNDTLLYAEEDHDCIYTWTKTRSRETDNIIVFWDKFYGDKAPDELDKNDFYYVDINDLLQKCEGFYDLECHELGFVNPKTSNVSKYKIMVLMNHTQTWTCYGGGYDYQVPALWLNPSTCKPVGHSVAHEVGHSFHYMCYSEDSNHGTKSNIQTGFHSPIGNGSVTWEQTAQWQANQSYPELMFSQSTGVFRNSHNLAFTHEWHRYQSYWFFYYLCQITGLKSAVADVWNYSISSVLDFNQVLMKQQQWTVTDLYQHYYEYAAHCATWDFDSAIPYRDAHIGDFHYAAVLTDDHQYQVAFASTPQSTGFNIIPLQVPSAGTDIKATFISLRPNSTTKLAEGDPALFLNGSSQWEESNRKTYFSTGATTNKGFRLGYEALMEDGTRQYFHRDSIYCKGTNIDTAEICMTVPKGTERLWMVVSPAPSKYYQHQWDDKYDANDDAWPYNVAFEGTDINESMATIYAVPTLDGRNISDVYFTYDVYLPVRNNYTPASVVISGTAAQLLGTALQMSANDIAGKMTAWKNSGPTAGNIMFYPIAPMMFSTVNRTNTANGFGHWFNANGNVTDYSNGYLYSEFDASTLTFNIGQYPGKVTSGQDYNIGQALVYNNGTGKATAYFRFRVHITDGRMGAELVEKTNAISLPTPAPTRPEGIYDLSGRPLSKPTKGPYIRNGKKIMK